MYTRSLQKCSAKSHHRQLYPNTLQTQRVAARRCHTGVKHMSRFVLLRLVAQITVANAINIFDMMLHARFLPTIGFDFKLTVYGKAAKSFADLGRSLSTPPAFGGLCYDEEIKR